MAEVYLGLGSNIDAERSLDLALTELEARFGTVELSRVYRNPAVGFAGDDFLNLVTRVNTGLAPAQIQQALHTIERAAARDRSEPRWGPRTLDIDLLLYGTRVDPLLRLPRSDILRYAFVLGPLAELAPGLIHPVTGVTMAHAWQSHADAKLTWTGEGRTLRQSLAWDSAAVAQPSLMVGTEKPSG
jgi:2-amino-4-hydroxy-6-hydroxymethyldihydropteridine diphosphokinase